MMKSNKLSEEPEREKKAQREPQPGLALAQLVEKPVTLKRPKCRTPIAIV